MELVFSTVLILILIFLGMSVPFCFLAGSLLYVFMTGMSTGTFVSTAFYALNSTSTLAIPLFMLAGTLIEQSGIARTLIDLAEIMLRKIKGGMGATIPLVSCFFGALSGSGTATCTTLATMMSPRLQELGWDKRYLAAFIAASGPLGYMIPPNMNAIIYTMVSNASVAALFLATIIPGIIWAGLYMLVNRLVYTKWYTPVIVDDTFMQKGSKTSAEIAAVVETKKQPVPKIFAILQAAIPAFLMPVIIMGGIYGGIFTPTEAGAVSCLYALIIGFWVFKKLNLKNGFQCFVRTGSSLGTLLIMFPMTLIFTRLLVTNGVPEMITNLITSISTNKIIILLIIDIVLFIAGFFLDAGVLLLVFPPLLIPTAAMIGVTEVQLGVIMFVAVGVGTITPPMAMNLFITGKICDVSVKDMIRPLVPFLAVGVLILLLVTYVPEASLFLPRLIMGTV
ncbi:MAG: C4-dicarboxylate transporter, DctM subunit [Thermoanaerobacteraceae bacterium]|nr:C4-dicarboxylate transporter, DctM subunit [Thermoanaerobacteraceae bacterium]